MRAEPADEVDRARGFSRHNVVAAKLTGLAMAYKSTAKQRLWLSCLGYDLSEAADNEEVRALFDDARDSGRYRDPPSHGQASLARVLGVSIDGEKTCNDAAGKLYQILLCRAWVFSVSRALSGASSTNYANTGLSEDIALAIAREMAGTDWAAELDQFATTDAREGDVFYRMSKKAQRSRAFQFVSERLGVSAPVGAAAKVPTPTDIQEISEVIPVSIQTVKCPKCQAPIGFVEEGANQRIVCERCGTAYTVRRRSKFS